MKEIVTELGRVDYLFCSVSTCGTIRGLAEYARDHGLKTRIVAVDAEGSVIFGGNKGSRRFPGLGAGIVPPFCRKDLIDHIVYVSDWEIVKAAGRSRRMNRSWPVHPPEDYCRRQAYGARNNSGLPLRSHSA